MKVFGAKIRKIIVLGERHSGTNALYKILSSHVANCNILSGLIGYNPSTFLKKKSDYFHKHYYPWLPLPNEEDSGKGIYKNIFSPKEDVLYICMVREVYDWLRGFFIRAHDVCDRKYFFNMSKDPEKRPFAFRKFIERTWIVDPGMPKIIDGWNPYQERAFKNILELRRYKNLNYLAIGERAPNFMLVHTESLRSYSGDFLRCLEKIYHIKVKNVPENLNVHIPPHFEIDWEIEKLVGYQRPNTIEEINS